ncbi:MAG TPA: hypothetical protein VGD27_19815 [Longimicrobiales bacterium]
MKAMVVLFVTCASMTACDATETRDTAQIGTREREVRDSVIGQSKLPGAPAVEAARDVQATSKERAAALDSIR